LWDGRRRNTSGEFFFVEYKTDEKENQFFSTTHANINFYINSYFILEFET